MKPAIIIKHLFRAAIILFLQVLVLMKVDLSFGNFNFISIFLYPLFIMSLPINIPRGFLFFLAFAYGLLIDIFYNSPGVHASSLLFTALFRGVVLKFLEPFEGYTNTSRPSIVGLGFNWYILYAALMVFFHAFVYFSVDAFTLIYFFEIVMNSVFSAILSLIVIIIFDLLLVSTTKF